MKTRILTQRNVRSLLSMDLAVAAVEDAFGAYARGEALMPAKVYLPIEQHDGDFRAMPALLAGAAGLKWVNSHPQNPSRHGLPSVLGMYILSDPATAQPLAVMDATWLTAVRTGAAGGVASRHLAKPAPTTIGFVGCGVQARTLLAAHQVVYPDGFAIKVADANREAAESFAAESGGTAVSVEQASACDIVCTATPVREPVVRREWVAAGAHINAMGADGPGKQELDSRILHDARVVIDDAHQATGSGEINVPLSKGEFAESDIYGTLGEIVAGTKPGREGDELTVFDSTGLAIQDVALASAVYKAACEQEVGQLVDFFEE